MNGIKGAQQTIKVGTECFVDSTSPGHPYAVVFEDDGDTGYFYAVNRNGRELAIQDALHIYNAANVTDGHVPSEAVIMWSVDGLKAALVINDYTHAIFDFEIRRGYCRTNFPPPNDTWPQPSHAWSDSALELFQ